MGRTVMGYWDCPVCGSKGIAGNVMNCPSCGRARGDVKFYMKNISENEIREEHERGDIEYLSAEQAQEIGKNPDWYCSFCNSLNKDHAAFCSNCGASRKDSESNYFDQLKKRQEAEAAEQAAQARPAQRQQPKSRRGLLILLIIAACVAGLIFYLNGSNTQGNLEVTGFAWSRSVPVEQNLEYKERGWSIPEGGTEISRSQEIHHYDQVLDHYESVEVQRSRQVLDHYETYYTYSDNGNGSFEEISHQRPVYTTEYYTETESRPVYRSVPRYQTQYVYSIWRWTPVREAEASGEDQNPFWPELNLKEDEREGSPRTERYSFTVTGEKGETGTWYLKEEDWKTLGKGNHVTISTHRGSGESWIVDEKGNPLIRVYAR